MAFKKGLLTLAGAGAVGVTALNTAPREIGLALKGIGGVANGIIDMTKNSVDSILSYSGSSAGTLAPFLAPAVVGGVLGKKFLRIGDAFEIQNKTFKGLLNLTGTVTGAAGGLALGTTVPLISTLATAGALGYLGYKGLSYGYKGLKGIKSKFSKTATS